MRALAGLACSSRWASHPVSVSSRMHSSSLPGPPAATISPSISPSPAAPSSPSRAAGPAGAGSPYVSRWTYSWSAAALRTLGNRWPSSSMTARSNSVRRLPRACSSSSTCIVSEAMMAAISLVDGDTAERIAWCSRPTNGAEAAPLRTSPGGGVRSGSSTRASRSCSVMRSSGSDRRASVRCSSRRLSRSSPTSWSSRTPACARCLLSAARAPRRVDSVMPPAETLSPRSAGLRYAGKESSRTVMGKHADGTRKSAASAGARQPGSAEWTNRRCSDPWDCTRGRGSRSTSARVVAANSRTRSIFSVTCWQSAHTTRWHRPGSAARSSIQSAAACWGGESEPAAVASLAGGSAKRSNGSTAAMAASRTQLPTSPRLSIW
mmetsp:Transcript_13876/g.45383  ORF Transcript_13876/g.45383 Transcript_13876/m.45383 type:complete len:378 (-) Transcript_13876:599-1732(-)